MNKEKGFSLVELMVALVIGLLLIAGVIELFVSTRQTYRVQDMKARMQEDGRYAIHHISSLLDRAGYVGCNSIPTGDRGVTGRNSGGTGRTVVNNLNTANNYFWDMKGAPVLGHEADNNGGWSPALPAGINQAIAGSDVFTLRTVSNVFIEVSHFDSSVGPSAPVKIPQDNPLDKCDPATEAKPGDCANIVIASDCEKSVIFQVTNDPSVDGNLQHETGIGTPGNSRVDLGLSGLSQGWLNTITTHTFFIRNGPSNYPSLYQMVLGKAPDVLIEGVEQMQVEYGVDTSNNGSVDQYVKANAVAEWEQVISVRISLVMINIDPQQNDNVALGNAAYTLEGNVITPNDGRLRQVFTKTITLRNRIL
ncbi:MAG: PilW family protein [Pseudomonadota bacterium]|uniref:PilW family protein n=1 Tax=Methylophaga aminisulfidivorans TaxID=230105 RepID=UPI0024E22375|nr:PilW family protein [Methylophaga aminisulfidivorans]MEC9411539.1 PilW family protein [Pseudomonadota bacterium]